MFEDDRWGRFCDGGFILPSNARRDEGKQDDTVENAPNHTYNKVSCNYENFSQLSVATVMYYIQEYEWNKMRARNDVLFNR